MLFPVSFAVSYAPGMYLLARDSTCMSPFLHIARHSRASPLLARTHTHTRAYRIPTRSCAHHTRSSTHTRTHAVARRRQSHARWHRGSYRPRPESSRRCATYARVSLGANPLPRSERTRFLAHELGCAPALLEREWVWREQWSVKGLFRTCVGLFPTCRGLF